MEYILLIVVLVVVSILIGVYNPIKQFQTKAKEALQDLENQLKNRAQLLTPFIAQIKTSNAALADKLATALQNQKELEISELLPEALNSQNTSEAGALKEVEKQIQDSIRYLNSTVTDYNAQLDGQIAKHIAGPLGLTKMALFGASTPVDTAAPTQTQPTVTQTTVPATAETAPVETATTTPTTPTPPAAVVTTAAPATPAAPAAPVAPTPPGTPAV